MGHPFRTLHGTNMSHLGHRVWYMFPSYSIITVSRTCLCRKCTLIAVLFAAHHLHPRLGIPASPLRLVKPSYMSTDIHLGSGYPNSVYLPLISHDVSSDALPATPLAFKQTEHFTLTLCLSWHVNYYTLIRLSYATSKWVPAARYGWQTIPDIFPMFVRSLTILNIPFRMTNSPCRHFGSIDETRS